MHEPTRVEAIDGIHAVERPPADDRGLEGYILACGENVMIIDNGINLIDLEAMGRYRGHPPLPQQESDGRYKKKSERLCATIQV
jgi:hypothetical protein